MTTNSLTQLLALHKVVIPPVQRDYAQGRNTGKIPHIRERFLDSLVKVLQDDELPTLELDFVYGYTEKDKINQDEVSIFKPLDGQQRLTTLFLIHWYIAQKEGKIDGAKALLEKFSYSTRQSSRTFCEKLVSFAPDFSFVSVDEQIVNQPWFFSDWKSDPTIVSMLVVLRDIDTKFRHLNNIWDKLAGSAPRVIFHLLPMEDLGLPDDLYIKMNARGKGLTDFEHFKSQFSEILDDANAKIFNEKIDKEWSDLFWNIFKEKESSDIAREVDNGFLSFFWYITDLLVNKKNITINSTFWLDEVNEVYGKSPNNVKFFFDAINLFEKLEKEQADYFNKIFYILPEDFEAGKTRIFFNSPQTNLFRKCAETYGFGEKSNSFSVGEQLLLYAFIYMQLNYKDFDDQKFRLLRNIFSSSEVQLRNEYLSAFLYNDVEFLIDKNEYSENTKLSKRQLEEEKLKSFLVIEAPELKEIIYRLEDHHLLRGNIALFDFDISITAYAAQFQKIFNTGCDYFEISKAMLSLGDYTQSYGKLRRYGNKNNSTWREIFTQSENRKEFDQTKFVVKKYLDLFKNNPKLTNAGIIESYLKIHDNEPKQPKDLRYYYIKYKSFAFWAGNQTDGFYSWDNYWSKPYECWMLFKKQFNGRHWSPFLLELSNTVKGCSIENYGSVLQYNIGQIILLIANDNVGFKFIAADGNEHSALLLNKLISNKELGEDGILMINQNKDGFDTEDRIKVCIDFLTNLKIDNSAVS
jgi:hypothetical protein